ncbi:MAG: MFS transporter [Bacteroidota bacterium]|jgi:MFS family permease|nr:MAG: MFS transporter [Bacteroidota bacterium]
MAIRAFRALQSRNFRLYFFGQSVSLIGTWMQRTAVYWVVYEETQSAFMLGATVFAAQFPAFLFSIVGGVVVDRYNRFRVLLTTQVASLVQAAALATLVATGAYEIWHILALTVMLGTINAFDVPARQSMIYDMVKKKFHVPNAIALNSSMVHLARIIGPALSGIVLEAFGATFCFATNAVSFAAVIVSLLMMQLPPHKKVKRTTTPLGDMKAGFTYLKDTPAISMVILMLACTSLLSLPYVTVLPVYAREIFQGDASTFGYLNSFVGLGAIAGAIFLASLRPGARLAKILLINTTLFGIGLAAFSHLTSLPLALACLILTGFGMMSQTTISNTIIQLTVVPAMRGRVLSYYTMVFFGMQPVGGLLIGTLTHYYGAPNTVLLQGIVTVLIAALFAPRLRRRELKSKDKMKIEQLKERSVETTG